MKKELPRAVRPAIEEVRMALVRYNQVMAFPVEVLIPMRLLVYNGGGRRLILRGGEQELAAPIAAWLQTSVEHGRLIATVEPVADPAAPAADVSDP